MSTSHLDRMEFENNPEPRCAVVLLLDTSGSMSGQPIAELNEGLRELERSLKKNPLTSLRVDIAIVTFGDGVQVLQPFVTVNQFVAPTLDTGGLTPMGEAVRRGLALLKERKEAYRANSIDIYRPWMFLITDGCPNDEWESATIAVKEEEARKGVVFYGIGVADADMETLKRFSEKRDPLKLKGLHFQELFQWLSDSLQSVSGSRPGEQVPLPPVGWAVAET